MSLTDNQARAIFFAFAAVTVGVAAYRMLGSPSVSEMKADAKSAAVSAEKRAAAALEKGSSALEKAAQQADQHAKSASSGGSAAAKPKPKPYTPSGDASSWSESDMTRFLESRSLDVPHGSSHEELQSMVYSKLNEPTGHGWDDPNEWSEADLKEYLIKNKIDVPNHSGRMELIAMAESKMHEPK